VPEQPDLSPRDVERLSGISYWTVLREIERGHLRAYRRPGNRLAIRHEDFCAWAYGQPVTPRQRQRLEEPSPRRSRPRPERGSVAALDELERRRGVRP
jgi:hypothetical protein